jgi:vacuolar-type H+-ATPase subunit H
MSDYTPQPPGEPLRWPREEPPAPSASVQSTIHQMTDQLQTVIEAAERAAEAIRHDAEEQARRHLAEAQRKADRLTAERVGLISELTDDLIRHAANVRDHSEQMVRALEDAINSVTDKLEQPAMSDPLAAPPTAMPPLPLGDPPAEGGRNLPPPPAHGGYTDLVGTPPPPMPASAPAPVPPRTPLPGPPTGAPQPTPDSAAAAAAAASRRPAERVTPYPATPDPDTGVADPRAGEEPPRSPPWGRLPGTRRARRTPTPIEPPLAEPPAPGNAPGMPPPPPGAGEGTASEDAVLHAGRLAAAGESRETIATALRQVWGVSDPDPIVDRVLSDG